MKTARHSGAVNIAIVAKQGFYMTKNGTLSAVFVIIQKLLQ